VRAFVILASIASVLKPFDSAFRPCHDVAMLDRNRSLARYRRRKTPPRQT
jgi:hypothetical protein